MWTSIGHTMCSISVSGLWLSWGIAFCVTGRCMRLFEWRVGRRMVCPPRSLHDAQSRVSAAQATLLRQYRGRMPPPRLHGTVPAQSGSPGWPRPASKGSRWPRGGMRTLAASSIGGSLLARPLRVRRAFPESAAVSHSIYSTYQSMLPLTLQPHEM